MINEVILKASWCVIHGNTRTTCSFVWWSTATGTLPARKLDAARDAGD